MRENADLRRRRAARGPTRDFLFARDVHNLAYVRRRVASLIETSAPCHAWLGLRDARGYGRMAVGFEPELIWRQMPAHRLVWLLEAGWLEAKLDVCHICQHRHCVNVDHLFLGTHRDNHDDYRLGRPLASSIAVREEDQ